MKNEIHAILIRRLKGRPQVSDLFGKAGRAWLAELELPIEERETLDRGLRQIDFLDGEVASVDRVLAHDALSWPVARRLMTVPGVNLIAAATFLAAVGNIERFPDRRKLVGYLGLDPKVRQSGHAPATHGHISKQGSAAVGSRWSRPAGARSETGVRCAPSISASVPAAATGSQSRPRPAKLACLFWVLLWRQPDYAFGQPSLTAKKIRRLEITAGAPRWQDRRGVWIAHRLLRDAELDLARQAEHACAQTIRDRQAAGAINAGASTTPGRASQKPSTGKAARLDHKPLTSALRYVSSGSSQPRNRRPRRRRSRLSSSGAKPIARPTRE